MVRLQCTVPRFGRNGKYNLLEGRFSPGTDIVNMVIGGCVGTLLGAFHPLNY